MATTVERTRDFDASHLGHLDGEKGHVRRGRLGRAQRLGTVATGNTRD